MQLGLTVEEIYELTAIDPWFLDKLKNAAHRRKIY